MIDLVGAARIGSPTARLLAERRGERRERTASRKVRSVLRIGKWPITVSRATLGGGRRCHKANCLFGVLMGYRRGWGERMFTTPRLVGIAL